MNKTIKPKILLLDFDGVISSGKYFSEIYSEKFNVPLEKLMPFFNEMKDSANIGKADLKEILPKVFNEWKWKGSVNELLEFWFNSDSEIDERIKNLSNEIRNKGIPVYLATDQEKYRTEFIWNQRKLKDWLDGRFVSCEIGFHKSDKRFFEYIVKDLNIDANEILFFDDSQSKIDSANSVGLQAILYKDFESFEEKILQAFKL